MRKLGPFRSIRLCAYTFVGAVSDEALAPRVAAGVPDVADGEKVIEAEDSAVWFLA